MEQKIFMDELEVVTPQEITDMEFGKALGGYKESEVDAFLDKVRKTLDYLIEENLQLAKTVKSQAEDLKEVKGELKKYVSMKDTLTHTLLRAEANAEDTCEVARKKAQEIIEEANAEAEKRIEEADKKVAYKKAQYEEIQNKCAIFKNEYIEMLNKEMTDISSYIFSNSFEEESVPNITE